MSRAPRNLVAEHGAVGATLANAESVAVFGELSAGPVLRSLSTRLQRAPVGREMLLLSSPCDSRHAAPWRRRWTTCAPSYFWISSEPGARPTACGAMKSVVIEDAGARPIACGVMKTPTRWPSHLRLCGAPRAYGAAQAGSVPLAFARDGGNAPDAPEFVAHTARHAARGAAESNSHEAQKRCSVPPDSCRNWHHGSLASTQRRAANRSRGSSRGRSARTCTHLRWRGRCAALMHRDVTRLYGGYLGRG